MVGSRVQLNSRYEGDFLSVMERERSRSQRFHTRTCVVEFNASQVRRPGKTVRVLLKNLAKRVRAIDRFGRITDDTIGLLLPDTEPTGADKVAHDVLCAMQPGELPMYTIHGYPEVQTTPSKLEDWNVRKAMERGDFSSARP